MDDADMIWNRALGRDYVPTLPGDKALRDVLAFHSLSMNGGVAHAIEVVGRSGATDAAHGYRLMGSAQLADVIDEALALAAPGITDDGRFDTLNLQDQASDALDALDERLPEDTDLQGLFQAHLAAHPDQFEPL